MKTREIFLVGGENIKTPSISIDVLPTDSAFLAAKKLATKMTPIPLSKLISSISIKSEYDIFYGDKIFKQRFVITLNFLPKYLLKPFNIKAKNLATFIQHTFMQKLVHEITKKTNLRSEKLEVKRDAELMEKTTKSDDDSEDESNEKKAQSSTCVLSSDSDDSFSEEEIDKELEKEDSFDDNSDDNKIDNTKAADQIFPKTMSNSKGFMFDKHESCCKFEFSIDLTPQRTALMPIIKKLVEKTIVNQTNTKNCFVTTNASGSKLHVEGNNIYDFWKYNDIVSLKTLYSNNIYKMCEYYGVEAARTVLVKEIQNVFGVYGIAVNNRHLSLLADYMTFHGAYRPCNRYGINSNPSSFQKMSFETTIQFLKNACTYGDFESLKSPSARLVTGLPINIGTGSFEILTK
ncbi:hypothetical protein MXB_5278 [Myxobolus squamalis]|nr:hypothetical protein MXB_5278 [Myxobolus squamalis]